MTRELTCIGCPMGCPITVELEGGEIKSITGYTCNIGKNYAMSEVTAPTRTVTTTALNVHAQPISCKTAGAIPKEKIFDVVAAIKDTTVPSPIYIGDVILSDVCGTGVDVVATMNG
ncbi:MAG: DUF1667 domain-containing protein [Ruminococcus sp.]|nr:DUF1667 domain-containing protein [Ruminococcus sp.]